MSQQHSTSSNSTVQVSAFQFFISWPMTPAESPCSTSGHAGIQNHRAGPRADHQISSESLQLALTILPSLISMSQTTVLEENPCSTRDHELPRIPEAMSVSKIPVSQKQIQYPKHQRSYKLPNSQQRHPTEQEDSQVTRATGHS